MKPTFGVVSASGRACLLVMSATNRERGNYSMPKCGVCGDHYGELLVKHGELCEDDRKAPQRTVNDIKREQEEGKAND